MAKTLPIIRETGGTAEAMKFDIDDYAEAKKGIDEPLQITIKWMY